MVVWPSATVAQPWAEMHYTKARETTAHGNKGGTAWRLLLVLSRECMDRGGRTRRTDWAALSLYMTRAAVQGWSLVFPTGALRRTAAGAGGKVDLAKRETTEASLAKTKESGRVHQPLSGAWMLADEKATAHGAARAAPDGMHSASITAAVPPTAAVEGA
ncbi:hypothetical protein CDD82_5267 [Ophiocordyceps australis]|uniref:Uncharacterized protein n=1 Tax=Ophiocordyceps australis TaxID=1399860 RepID=A0A2C5Z1Y3_9HYPO|nr:hypothetical protein CDD82_5267 [Ophiocordyceps australis]